MPGADGTTSSTTRITPELSGPSEDAGSDVFTIIRDRYTPNSSAVSNLDVAQETAARLATKLFFGVGPNLTDPLEKVPGMTVRASRAKRRFPNSSTARTLPLCDQPQDVHFRQLDREVENLGVGGVDRACGV